MAKIYPYCLVDRNIVSSTDATLSIASSAVLYGLSVYTVFPVCKTDEGFQAFRLKDHFERLENSARIIGIDKFIGEWTFDEFVKSASELIKKNNPDKDVFVRASVHVTSEVAGTRSRDLDCSVSMFVYDAAPILPQKGAKLKTSVWRRIPDNSIPSRAKVNGAYVNSVLAKQDAIDSGYDDSIFLDQSGHVCELSAANIFLVRNNSIITPSVSSDLLEGINRRTIIEELSGSMGLEVYERQVDLTELYIADEIFASGTGAYIAPVTNIDARKIGSGQVGLVAEKLQKLHFDVLHGKVKKYSNWLTKLT